MKWLGAIAPDGYGLVRVPGSQYRRAHRVAYELAKGVIPPKMFVCHRCDTPTCVNPDHLWVGTPKANVEDMIGKGRANTTARTRGTQSIHAKLREDQIPAILADVRMKKDIAREYGVHPSIISRIKSGHAWKHAGSV